MIPARVALLLLAAAALASGVMGGLARLGAPWEFPSGAALHGALMVGGFLGTVVSLERAVALGSLPAYAAPLAAGLGLALALAGFPAASAALMLAAPVLLLAASVAIVRRQRALHTVSLAVAALAWLAGNACHVYGAPHLAPPWWFAFLVLTIAAERLELTRLVKRRAAARPLFLLATAALLAGAAHPVVFGAALAGMAAWLAVFDIARRTLRAGGLAGYAAAALIGGYAWLAVGGLAWAGTVLRADLRDAAIHAVGLGFVFSMIFAHAPIIVPVVARARVAFVPLFYAPLALLHASLIARLGPGFDSPAWRLAGGVLNAAAIVAFVATLLFAIRRGRNPVDAGQRAASAPT